tara:strand:+ start:31 stop:381 length:351 start_codon:yes stop_codon:yes gene_type:complete
MAHYARVTSGIVTAVIVAEAEFFDNFVDDVAGEWLQTSYNTRGGVHLNGGTPLRKNFASIGDNYDAQADAFYEQQPFPSWELNTTSYIWHAPVECPDDGNEYAWNEETTSWDEITE